MKKTKKTNFFLPLKPEYLFLLLGFVIGLFYVFVNPPFQTNDENDHFYCAYLLSKGYFIPAQEGNKIGGIMPRNLKSIVQSFQGIPFYQGTKISRDKVKEFSHVPLNKSDSEFFHNFYWGSRPFPFIPHALGIIIGGVFNSNPVWLGWFGRIGGLICYLIIIFFAIRITPIHKSVFMLYALAPMLLYQAASVTYDTMSNGLTFLLIAIFLKLALDNNHKIDIKDLIAIIIITLVHRLAKDGYVLIPLAFFIIPPKKFGGGLKSALIMSGFFIYFLLMYDLPGFIWSPLLSNIHLTEALPLMKKDFVTNLDMNLNLQLSNPIGIIGNLVDNIVHFRQEWLEGTIGRFGYSYTLLPEWFYIIFGLVTLTFALLDSDNRYLLRIYQKSILVLVGIGSVMLVIGALYFNSPVGSKMVFGFQGRYLIPAVPILLLLLYNNHFENKFLMQWKYLLTGIFIIAISVFTLNYLGKAFYLP